MGAHRNSIYDKAYAEMYAKGMSLAETAKSIGVTRQCVYKAFKKRGFRLRTSIPCGFQIYDGKKFTLRSNGYYALTTDDRCLMHRYIWEKEICDIPDGWDVHHINGDKSDNRRDNLVCFQKRNTREGIKSKEKNDTHRSIFGNRRVCPRRALGRMEDARYL